MSNSATPSDKNRSSGPMRNPTLSNGKDIRISFEASINVRKVVEKSYCSTELTTLIRILFPASQIIFMGAPCNSIPRRKHSGQHIRGGTGGGDVVETSSKTTASPCCRAAQRKRRVRQNATTSYWKKHTLYADRLNRPIHFHTQRRTSAVVSRKTLRFPCNEVLALQDGGVYCNVRRRHDVCTT